MRCASPCGSEAPGSVTSTGAPAGRRGLISTTSRALSQSAPPDPSRDREQRSCSRTPRCSRPNSRRKPGGGAAVREYAERFGDVRPEGGAGAGAGAGAPLFYDRAALREALARLPAGDRARLERVAERIRGFAEAQYRALCPVAVSVPGGVAEHQIAPVERAGCYAPGGRYPPPSSVLMTAVTAHGDRHRA